MAPAWSAEGHEGQREERQGACTPGALVHRTEASFQPPFRGTGHVKVSEFFGRHSLSIRYPLDGVSLSQLH